MKSVTPLQTTAPQSTMIKEMMNDKNFMHFSADFIQVLDASDPESTGGGTFCKIKNTVMLLSMYVSVYT